MNSRKLLVVLVLLLAAVTVYGGGRQESAPVAERVPVIGFSNAGLGNSWSAGFHHRAAAELEKIDGIQFYVADGQDSITKQISDVEDLLTRGIDLLIIRPENPEALASVVEDAYNSGIPVVVAGRNIATDKYTTFVMLDDRELGRRAAERGVELLIERFGQPRGKVFELQGNMASGSARFRNEGMMSVFERYPDIEMVAQQAGNYQRGPGRDVTENVLQSQPELDLVISHGGEMLAGALEAIEAEGRMGEAIIVNVDGYNGILKAMAEGKVDFTVLYPVELGAEAVQVAMRILNGETVPREWAMPVVDVHPGNVEEFVDWNAPDAAWTF